MDETNNTRNDEVQNLSTDESAMLKLLAEAQLTRKRNTISMTIDGREWKVRTTSQAQNEIMSGLDYDIL